MKNFPNEAVWAECYRPKSIAETILPKETKALLQSFVDAGDVGNHMLFAGKSGMGKTTAARALAHDLDADCLVIPASINNGIDTLRETMISYASTVSFSSARRKILILDEADHLNQKSVMPALRNFMDDFGHNCALIMTCNYKSRIIDPLLSRIDVIDFVNPKEEKPMLAGQFSKRIEEILRNENVTYERAAIIEVIKKKFPDWRAVLNHLQKVASVNGTITLAKATNYHGDEFAEFLKFIQARQFTPARKWLGENADIDTETFYRTLYDTIPGMCEDVASTGMFCMVMARYQSQEAIVADTEINRAGLTAEIMAECKFKS